MELYHVRSEVVYDRKRENRWSDEVIDYYKIENGSFDTISDCKYSIQVFWILGSFIAS